VQNVAGVGVAKLLGAPAALGIICGSLTLTGGPATGLAFTSLFEQKGIAGAGTLIIASATFGIFVSSLVGNPVATALVRRFRLAQRVEEGESAKTPRDEARAAEEQFWAVGSIVPPGGADGDTARITGAAARGGREPRIELAEALAGGELLRILLIMLAVMGVGALVGMGLGRLKVTLPAYVGAMVCAAVVRNLDERFGWFRLDMRAVEALGLVALALFLVIALMDLKLWQLAGLAVPMLVILAVQVVLTVLYSVLVVFTLMGRDYEAAVTTGGHIGFGLGVTPNAVANMEALAARFGPAPRSFLYVPVVGAFFIDFSNALVITVFANLIG
jgi:ESS family glutamate:Na+ symporter